MEPCRARLNLPHKDAKAYARRNRFLREMGFQNYAAYLDSPLWASIRFRILLNKKHRKLCLYCGHTAVCVHHRKYTRANLRGLSLAHLVPVCSACHEAAERSPDGEKKGLRSANATLDSIRSKHAAKPARNRLKGVGARPRSTTQDDYWSERPTKINRGRHP